MAFCLDRIQWAVNQTEDEYQLLRMKKNKNNPHTPQPFLLIILLQSLTLFWLKNKQTKLCMWKDHMHINRQMAHLIIDSVSCSCTQTSYHGHSLTSIFLQLLPPPPPAPTPPACSPPPTTLKLSTAWKTCLMFMVFECVDLADMLSLWCCNPVTNSVLYLLVGI